MGEDGVEMEKMEKMVPMDLRLLSVYFRDVDVVE